MSHRKIIITLSSLLVFALRTWAQTPLQHQHPNLNLTVVDGAKNPELIPDSTAYRVWFVTVSLPPNAGEKERKFQQAHLSKLQLTSNLDYLQLLTILTGFKSKYLALIAQYNESAKAALPGIADQQSFLQQRDDLVSSTRAAIKAHLTSDSTIRIDAHVQGEKARIQIHTTGGTRP